MPDVTLVIPTIGRASLETALQSALAQTVPFTEIIVETDSLREGPVVTRNRACAKVQTEWTAFLDDDDVLYPHHVETCLAVADHFDVIYPWWDGFLSDQLTIIKDRRRVSPKGLPFDEQSARNLRRENFIPVTAFVRTALGASVGWFPERNRLIPHEDWGLWLKLIRSGARFGHVDAVTWRYTK